MLNDLLYLKIVVGFLMTIAVFRMIELLIENF